MSLRVNASSDAPSTMRLRALVGNQVMLLLVDSGSTHSFVNKSFVDRSGVGAFRDENGRYALPAYSDAYDFAHEQKADEERREYASRGSITSECSSEKSSSLELRGVPSRLFSREFDDVSFTDYVQDDRVVSSARSMV